MNVHVAFEAQLREVAGVPSVDIELADGIGVIDALTRVAGHLHQDALRKRLLKDDNTLQPGVLIFVNDQPVVSADTQIVSDGDTILLLPPISGG